MNRPNPTAGLRHVALYVEDLAACERFYVDLLGMEIEWRPDADNVYLTSGCDNLALHKLPEGQEINGLQTLDHIGFILKSPEDVDDWHDFFSEHKVEILTAPRTHRDGARSFYSKDPAKNTVQMIYHPPIS